ncbi:MAG TPA: hypothetical protein DGG95_16530 [Cytophagales bacterium]|jgi:glycosyltransferase involved in cell wall biosynthesis|nr:hypothetical protein [Cytophagales bacterium]
MNYTVSVRLMTFNQEEYIGNAIESILMQQTDFFVEVVIGDDFSTDRTLEILKSYSSTDKIHIKILERGVGDSYWRKRQELGRLYNFRNIIENCTGKYIALLDGDDYWTDPLKLQKQVDLLEADSKLSICFHNVKVHNSFTESIIDFLGTNFKGISELDELFEGNNYIPTCSVVYRRNAIVLPPWFTRLPFGDYGLHIIAARSGKIKYINETMGVYRVHHTGAYSRLTNTNEGLAKAYQQHFKFWKILYERNVAEKKKMIRLLLKSLHKIVDYSFKSGQFSIALRYNVFFLRYGGMSHLRLFAGNLKKIIAAIL